MEDSVVELREKLGCLEFQAYSKDHRRCTGLTESLLDDIIDIQRQVESRPPYREHFRGTPPVSSLIGTYMYYYGFETRDVGNPSNVQSLKRPFPCQVLYSDPEDSDFEPGTDCASEGEWESEKDTDDYQREAQREDLQEYPRKKQIGRAHV